MLNILHWADTNDSVESVFKSLAPANWRYISARTLSDLERHEELRRADAVIVVNLDFTASEIDVLEHCKLVVHQGVGTDNVDVDRLLQRGIPLDVTSAGTTEEVAEYAIMLMLASSRFLKAISGEVDARRWPTWNYRSVSRSLAGRNVGLVGFGRIGQAVASRLLAMKAHVHVFPGPGRDLSVDWQGRVNTAPSLEALCRAVDLLSLHVPLRADTAGMVDAKMLDCLPHGAMLVNTGRGQLIDEIALAERLADGRLAAAALDVVVPEPPPADHPLLGLPNVLVTPHLSSGTRDSLEAKVHSIISRISATLAPTSAAVK
ncbi:NAD(P)-dependent oxidoreductase [Aureimonas fodinaquatilis]|uniref:NAD(P)-dependent oxidoreductase n=1 Tax=Aureimonas fodinaquatilis TaxID=2565783 RepID=UPI00165D8DD8|nr:NAD(P)-dependent oxidoreductase [Aureimonas fodinaquatilis]